MALPPEALALIKEFEGYLKKLNDGTDRVKPYYCPAGVPTIGWGTTRYPNGVRVKINDPPIGQATATSYLAHELNEDEAAFDRYTAVRLHPLSRGAIVSFIYNCGAGAYRGSTLRRKINDRLWSDVPRELAKWRLGGGRVLAGLVRRRAAEADLFIQGVRLGNYPPEPVAVPPLPARKPEPQPAPALPPADDLPFWRRVVNWILS